MADNENALDSSGAQQSRPALRSGSKNTHPFTDINQFEGVKKVCKKKKKTRLW